MGAGTFFQAHKAKNELKGIHELLKEQNKILVDIRELLRRGVS